ncbi:50S ribosomal protein L3-2 [Forsythia ovata]|uniref:50S ribosomal protein L3-2 n=1 Tax=Forsythia ovata TaxID=205694 RepID=A0ABD1V0Q8_9LAMI
MKLCRRLPLRISENSPPTHEIQALVPSMDYTTPIDEIPLEVKEIPVSEDVLLHVSTCIGVHHFVPGQYVDVTGVTKGKGFQMYHHARSDAPVEIESILINDMVEDLQELDAEENSKKRENKGQNEMFSTICCIKTKK